MTITLNSENFPLVKITTTSEYITDETEFIETLDKVFGLSKKHKMMASVYLDVSKIDGMSFMATCRVVKHLVSNRSKVYKYISKTGVLVESTVGMMSIVLGMYQPVRPLELFDDEKEILQWLIKE